jgi:hypothetical protein
LFKLKRIARRIAILEFYCVFTGKFYVAGSFISTPSLGVRFYYPFLDYSGSNRLIFLSLVRAIKFYAELVLEPGSFLKGRFSAKLGAPPRTLTLL